MCSRPSAREVPFHLSVCPAAGMNYFPMIIKTAHLAALRDHVIQRHNASHFDAVFAELIARCPFASLGCGPGHARSVP
jgi:hypothetical protein